MSAHELEKSEQIKKHLLASIKHIEYKLDAIQSWINVLREINHIIYCKTGKYPE